MTSDAVPVHDAASVVLLRDGVVGLEAWMLTRVREMVFAPGMTVFPGGRIEDGDDDLPWSGPAAASVADRLGCAEPLARALVGAAVRETFEETTVLLTSPPARLDEYRADVEARRLRFGELLREWGLAVDAEALRPWSRWITPAGEVRRYDTRFFVAALPAGAQAADVTTESSVAQWLPVGAALAEHGQGVRTLLPPTRATLTSIAEHRTVADVLVAAQDRRPEPVTPVLHNGPAGPYVTLPDGTTMSVAQ